MAFFALGELREETLVGNDGKDLTDRRTAHVAAHEPPIRQPCHRAGGARSDGFHRASSGRNLLDDAGLSECHPQAVRREHRRGGVARIGNLVGFARIQLVNEERR